MIVSDQMHAIAKKIRNRSITSKWKKCFGNSNLKLHVNIFAQELWFQTMITNYVSVCKLFRGFIAITVWNSANTGRHNHLLCFHKPGSPGSNVRIILLFIICENNEIRTWIIHFGWDKKNQINTVIFISLHSQGCKNQVRLLKLFSIQWNWTKSLCHRFLFASIDVLFTIGNT